jgi:hypothetical protein
VERGQEIWSGKGSEVEGHQLGRGQCQERRKKERKKEKITWQGHKGGPEEPQREVHRPQRKSVKDRT